MVKIAPKELILKGVACLWGHTKLSGVLILSASVFLIFFSDVEGRKEGREEKKEKGPSSPPSRSLRDFPEGGAYGST